MNLTCKLWNEKQTKYLLDQYRIYFLQIGQFRSFKNKTAMYEQISKDLNQQFGMKVIAQQCLNRYKNVCKHNKNALNSNRISGNDPTEMPYKDEFEGINNMDDSLQPEILLGVNQVKNNDKLKRKF